MLTKKSQVEEPRGREYGCGVSGTEQPIVATKPSIKGWSQGAVQQSQFLRSTQKGEELMNEQKPFLISKREVWKEYQRVKANKGAAGSTNSRLRSLRKI